MKGIFGLLLVLPAIGGKAQTPGCKAIFQKGQQFERTVEIKSTMTMSRAGQTHEMPNGMTLVSLITIKDVTETACEIITSTTRFDYKGNAKVRKDSADGSPEENIGKTLVNSSGNIISSTDTNHISKEAASVTGSISLLKATTRDPGNTYELIGTCHGKSLKLGDEWSNNFQVGGVSATVQYKVIAVKEGEATISLSGKASGVTEIDNIGLAAKFKTDASSTGTLTLDPSTGIIKSITELTESKGTYEFGSQTLPAAVKTSCTITIKPRQP